MIKKNKVASFKNKKRTTQQWSFACPQQSWQVRDSMSILMSAMVEIFYRRIGLEYFHQLPM